MAVLRAGMAAIQLTITQLPTSTSRCKLEQLFRLCCVKRLVWMARAAKSQCVAEVVRL